MLSFACPVWVRADEAPRPSASRGSRLLIGHDTVAVGVTLDFAKLISFDQPARTIIIGNPAIADGTLSDEYNLVLTGKATGVTNMIILGDMGQEVANLSINVISNNGQLTTVHHGASQRTYSCAGSCRPVASDAAKAK